MKVGFLFSEIFWGLLLIVLGISAVLRSFNINVPFFRVILAFVLIYLGISMLMGGPFVRTVEDNTVIFGELRRSGSELTENEFNVIFGSGELDLRDLDLEDTNFIEMNVVFGSGKLIISREQLAEIKISSAFGNALLPDRTSITFGDYTYLSPNLDRGERPSLIVEGSVVFGRLEVEER